MTLVRVWREQKIAADAAAAGKSEIGSKLDLMMGEARQSFMQSMQ